MGLEEKHGVGETFSTKNTLSTIVPRTQKRKQLTKQPENKITMDLRSSDSERESGKEPDPNLPDYEESSSDEGSGAPKPEKKTRAPQPELTATGRNFSSLSSSGRSTGSARRARLCSTTLRTTGNAGG